MSDPNDDEPFADVDHEILDITPTVLSELVRLRDTERFEALPSIGAQVVEERHGLRVEFGELIDRLHAGLECRSQKRWMLERFQTTLASMTERDTEVRECFGMRLERVMDALGIESSDGVLAFCLGSL